MSKHINRRGFMNASLAGVGGATLMGSLPLSLLPPGVRADFGDYKVLVCLFLFGGNDGFNLLVPRSDAEYNVYAASRQNMAVAQDDLLPINPVTSDGVEYGLHPRAAGLQTLFEASDAALFANIGPLIEPTTKDQYFNQSVALPPQLFSHNDQQTQWHTLKGRAQSSTGWAGRLADLLGIQAGSQLIPTTASMFGTTIFLSGDSVEPYVMGPGGPVPFVGFGDSGLLLEQKLAFQRIVEANYGSIYERAFASVQQRALANAELVTAALAGAPTLTTTFPQSQLGTQLNTVARLISVREALQMERQVFFVAKGGFDTHDEQVQNQPDLIGDVADSVQAFFDATVELGVQDGVTTFTQSDFGRTLTSNGDGTDHAWGSVQFAVGGSVSGREIYGSYPLLAIGGDDDVGGGRIIPTTSADQYAATLASWMGVSLQDIGLVAPNVGNFAVQNLGFLA